MSKYTFFSWTDELSQEWDTFVMNHPYGSIHQTSAWRKLQKTIPGRKEVLGFGVRNTKGKILAITLCVRMETGIKKTFWYYSPRGPVFNPVEQSEAGKFLIQRVIREIKNSGALFWRIDPYLSQADYKPLGLKKKASQNYQPTDTLVLNLNKSTEELLSDMKRKGRYNIKLAQKKGITIRHIFGDRVKPKDLSAYISLSEETTSRDGFSGHQSSYYHNFIENLAPHTHLFLGEYEEKTIAAAILTICGDKSIYYFGASTSDPQYRNLMAPYLLQWEMIQYAKSQGCTTYDFLGIAPQGVKNHPYSGISDFKWKFGGDRHTYDTGREIVFRPFLYKLYRMFKTFQNLKRKRA